MSALNEKDQEEALVQILVDFAQFVRDRRKGSCFERKGLYIWFIQLRRWESEHKDFPSMESNISCYRVFRRPHGLEFKSRYKGRAIHVILEEDPTQPLKLTRCWTDWEPKLSISPGEVQDFIDSKSNSVEGAMALEFIHDFLWDRFNFLNI